MTITHVPWIGAGARAEIMYGLDLFSGIGGLTKALEGYSIPVAYCEKDAYCQQVLLSRMATGDIPPAPIWDDICTLQRGDLPISPDIIWGGFPCQDVSLAGLRVGLEGKRTGLFSEIIRLVDEIRPRFVFLENVPGIVTQGLATICAEFAKRRYDARWTNISAASLGAPHLRFRWFLLAYSGSTDGWLQQVKRKEREDKTIIGNDGQEKCVANTTDKRLSVGIKKPLEEDKRHEEPKRFYRFRREWWPSEPDICRVVDGLPRRVDRIKSLGNAVVPIQAREAFERLMGIN